ncbi:MAG: pantetheine-phosphate adenylyltransferase [Acholeplasmatales bacterium]|nr:pantetheine-phosphate adenylyltransferase [Acholeplasmatales bacterium]
MSKAVYPGSFDPLSNGHLDIIKRASRIFDEVHVVVSINVLKKSIFTPEERMEMVKTVTSNLNNVVVRVYDGLVVNYCKENNINVIVRGMRNYSDYENEFSLFQYNRDIDSSIETVLLMPTTKNQVVSSSAIKELVTFGCDITKYVPKEIKEKIVNRIKGKE